MKSISFDEGKRLEETQRCAVCGGRVTLAWGGSLGVEGWVVRCARNLSHRGLTRPAEPFELFAGMRIPKGRWSELTEKYGPEVTTALRRYDGVATLPEEEIRHIYDLFWPQAPDEARARATIVCFQYGLNPLLKHIALIPFEKKDPAGHVIDVTWEVVQEISSNRIIARRRHRFSYLDQSPRIMTEQEEVKDHGQVDASRVWAITLLRDQDTGEECTGVGWYPSDKKPFGTDKGNSRLNQAKIRSERNALDRQYPAELPQGIRVTDQSEIEGDFTTVHETDGAEDGAGLDRAVGSPPPPGPGAEPAAGDQSVANRYTTDGNTGNPAACTGSPAGATGSPAGAGPGNEQTTAEAKEGGKIKKSAEGASPAAAGYITGNKFAISEDWLSQAQKALKWTDSTLISFLVTRYKVAGKGAVTDVLKRLTREQAEDFTKDMDNRKDKQSHLL